MRSGLGQPRRLALVVGDAGDTIWGKLGNADNDAQLIAKTLKGLDFTLITGGALIDPDRQRFQEAIKEFGKSIGPDTVALFYFAGHGIQYHGNYLVPRDAKFPQNEDDYDRQLIEVSDYLLQKMRESGARLSIVVLDACRDHPPPSPRLFTLLMGRGAGQSEQGLAAPTVPAGGMNGAVIFYSTAPNDIARDRVRDDDINGPFAKAFANAIVKPGTEMKDAFDEVQVVVREATSGKQQPWISYAAVEKFFFFDKGARQPVASRPPLRIPPIDNPTPALVHPQEFKVLRTLRGHTDQVLSISFSPDGQLLASGSNDSTVRLWEVASGFGVQTLTGQKLGIQAVAFSPDPSVRTIASGANDNTIRLWAASGFLQRTLTNHTSYVTSLAFSSDGLTLASGSWDNTIKLWDMMNGHLLKSFQGTTAVVYCIAISPDAKTIAAGSGLGEIALHDLGAGKPLRSLIMPGFVKSVAFSFDGQVLAGGGQDKTVKLWDWKTATWLRTLAGHDGAVNSIAFVPGGRLLVSGSDDGLVRLWDFTSGDLIVTMKDHTDRVIAVAASPDGRTIASAGADRSIKIWDISPASQVSGVGRDWIRKPGPTVPTGQAGP